ncbi:putative manganese-transporting ATPase PDR2, partial [Sesamum angolense]
MSRFHVGGKVVDTLDLLRKRHWGWRLDMWPFTILYGVWLAAVVPSLDFGDASIVLGGILAFHVLVFLFTVWSVDFKCFVQYSKVNDIYRADACKITPAKFSGSKEVVPLHFRKGGDQLDHTGVLCNKSGSSTSSDTEEIYFDFRKQRFIYSQEENLLFEYPQPTFQKLMKEQIMEPFFVFQVFCVGLWCLDEYWYYSLFTLFMLFMFESTMAKSRLKTLSELRRVKVDSQTLMVYRCGKWVKLSGTELLPGDVVSIGRSTGLDGEDKSVPADMLILAGSAIVNEAILTGESTPQWKVSVIGRGADEKLSARRDKAHVLFGGTKILQHTPDKTFHLKAPDGGCVAVVLRTGFETSQGKLMRTILFSTERVTANSWESGLFILFLVVFALIAAGYVLKKGLEDPTRSRYKLLLSCSLIITSVIPPELPMELSIAVNTSLIALARRGIYCTEPFRIPFAGKVDICCFDKTGTLTSDDMEFSGVGGLTDSEDLETEMSKVPDRTLEILASCHALVFVDNKLVGDPLEKAALKGIEWTYKSDEKAMPKKGGANSVQIVQRHHFASYLKRMAVVVRVQEQFFAFVKMHMSVHDCYYKVNMLEGLLKQGWAGGSDEQLGWLRFSNNAKVKNSLLNFQGAPETIQERLVDVPSWYVNTYKKHTRQGSRVLALAYKSLPEMT